jgi:uncharacterized glyoxalase superfamily protein PhnB
MLANRSMPPGDVIPVIGYADVATAAAWLCEAFGFVERLRIGDHRIQLRCGGGSIVLVAAALSTESAQGQGNSVMVRVEDADAHCARAKQAGARIISPPTGYPYGERQYSAEDFAGHNWTFSQTVADIAPADWGGELLSDM